VRETKIQVFKDLKDEPNLPMIPLWDYRGSSPRRDAVFAMEIRCWVQSKNLLPPKILRAHLIAPPKARSERRSSCILGLESSYPVQ